MSEKTILFSEELDQQFLEELYQGDTEYAAVVFANFLEELPPMMNDCAAALSVGDTAVFKKAVHKVKPIFSYVGLTNISASFERLEKQCDEADIKVLASNYAAICNQIKAGLIIIEKEKDKFEAINKNQ